MTLFYIMDPMCSWCYGFHPSINAIREKWPQLDIQYITGGLAPDSDEPMPIEMQNHLRSVWQQIEARTGVSFNTEFWDTCAPRRSTYPACRAVNIAAQLLDNGAALMTQAIQQAYYQDAKNPSDNSTLIALAVSIGVNKEDFSAALTSQEAQRTLEENIEFAHALGAQGFPALRYEDKGQYYRVSDGYAAPETIIKRLENLIQ
ncbi:DsbA family protein [Neptunomonas phycophila]|uniref:DsbA family protein n=1 Tax=Neptunomonas phycophila TaxID=1572645 RepID=A0ABT9ER28_9GAMM|nr:DsbA family protein [Neptunomonas phycophila]MDP2521529.1 DsbA family protein [Neptunomonas phycophila]